MANITVLSPVGEPRAATAANNFDRLVEGIGEALKERLGVARVVHARKANAASPAAPDLIAALAKECDLVFAGSAD